MKIVNYFLLIVIIILNLIFAPPSLADAPKITKNSDYVQITKSLNTLLDQLEVAKSGESTSEIMTVEDLEKRIEELSFEKYALEKGINWGQCRNETGKTIAIYGTKPENAETKYDNLLYFLGDGQTTPTGWDCQGIYLPNDTKIANLNNQEISGAAAIKILKGTQLIARNNPEIDALQLNINPHKIFKSGDINWYIPNVSETNIASRVPDILVSAEEEID